MADNERQRRYQEGCEQLEEEERVGNRARKGFAGVVGMQALKDQLKEEVLFPMKNKEHCSKYMIHPSNGMLLYDPPGCGKTFIALKFAEESKMNFKFIRASDVGSQFIHNTAVRIRDMFENAKQKAPCILCIDEIDAICPVRSTSTMASSHDYNESTDEFLSHLSNCHEHGIFVIGTTNNPLAIDPALLRTGRMDNVVYVPLPDEESRRALLMSYMEGRPQEENIDYDLLAKLTKGMNCSDIEAMVNTVSIRAALKFAKISSEALAEQAKTQRRSVYIPDDDDETMKSAIGKKHVIGFANYQDKDVRL